ncbi:MAG: TatD family hydrolase [Exilispira sp.]
MYIDSHCHIDLIANSIISIKNILQNATSFKISKIVQVSASLNDFSLFFPKFSGILSNEKDKLKYPQIFFTFGASPNDLSDINYDCKKLLDFYKSFEIEKNEYNKENFTKSNFRLIAIGEIGLDYFHKFFEKDKQIVSFENQLELSKYLNLPVMLHIRDSFDDALSIIKNSNIKKPLIFHCYSGDKNITEKILSNFENSFFSFAGNITYKKMDFLRESLKIIPKDKILIETDAPFLAPIPYRGKDNLPWYIIQTYNFISSFLALSEQELLSIIDKNFNKAFEL